MSLLLGTHEIDITPELPIQLAGFAHRQGKAMEVHSPLFLKTYYFEKKDQVFFLFIGDVIWWDDEKVKSWRKKLASTFAISPDSICFHATHNHSGPQTSEAFTSLLGEIDQSFIQSLEEKILESATSAIGNKEPVTITVRKTESDISVYRRVTEGDQVLMKPNRDVYVNKDVTIITFTTAEGDMKGMLIHDTCHPTSTDANVVSSEFTGQCCSILKETYQHTVIGFIQGCCGDIRPAFIKDNEFYRGNLEDMEHLGKRLAEDVLIRLMQNGRVIECDNIQAKITRVPLIFQENHEARVDPPVLEIWKKHVHQHWKDKNEAIFEIQVFQISDELEFVFFNAEMVQHYGEYIKQKWPEALALGYSNGMIGYLATQQQIRQGGYEAKEFIYYFGLPAPFHIKTEETIQNAIEHILEGDDK
ncbi:hypothetical protein ABE096_01260 [Robertmurraya massiliosenegalensis]|uniref:hypothetical protein n=1 Tax=Robertmurraya TaxID=2837507 RepID=UPI0039A448A2